MDVLRPGRTRVMGIVNVTPDSFSDGGAWFDTHAAIDHGLRLVAEGADILDVGGESTRPGAQRPSVDEELRRVVPVVTALAQAGAVVSLDTMRAVVAAAGVDAGASIINDVSGGLADEAMMSTVAQLDVAYVAMHWRGHGAVMGARATYGDVVAEVTAELTVRVGAAVAAGIDRSRIVADPGLGFAKTAAHNWTVLAHLEAFEALGLPLLIGASRKRFLGELLDGRPTSARDDATVALTTLCALQRVWAVRTHTVRAHRDAIAVVERLRDECPA